jgi:hypothetical protein
VTPAGHRESSVWRRSRQQDSCLRITAKTACEIVEPFRSSSRRLHQFRPCPCGSRNFHGARNSLILRCRCRCERDDSPSRRMHAGRPRPKYKLPSAHAAVKDAARRSAVPPCGRHP